MLRGTSWLLAKHEPGESGSHTQARARTHTRTRTHTHTPSYLCLLSWRRSASLTALSSFSGRSWEQEAERRGFLSARRRRGIMLWRNRSFLGFTCRKMVETQTVFRDDCIVFTYVFKVLEVLQLIWWTHQINRRAQGVLPADSALHVHTWEDQRAFERNTLTF